MEDVFRHCAWAAGWCAFFSAELARRLLGDDINPPLRPFLHLAAFAPLLL